MEGGRKERRGPPDRPSAAEAVGISVAVRATARTAFAFAFALPADYFLPSVLPPTSLPPNQLPPPPPFLQFVRSYSEWTPTDGQPERSIYLAGEVSGLGGAEIFHESSLEDMPTGTMRSLFAESSSSSSSSSGSGRDREAEPVAAVLCAPRPRRVQVHPCSADLILGPPPSFLLNSSGNGSRKQREGKSKTGEDDEEEGGWGLFGGSPPARADNPLVHDPHFLLNQRHHHHNAAASDISLAVFDSHRNHHVPTYSNSSSFAPSYAPAVRIQGFDVASCRSSHSGNAGGRVLSARA